MLHPCMTEARVVWRRQLRASAPAAIAVVLLVVGVCGALVLALRASGVDTTAVLARAMQAFGSWPLAIGAVMAALAYATTRSRLLVAAEQMHHGWWGAVPVDPPSVARTLAVLALIRTALVALPVAALLVLASLLAERGDTLAPALLVTQSGLVLGAIGGLVAASRHRGARRRPARGGGIRQPIFPLSGWQDRRLPHLFDWQRREATLRWRRGGSFWWVGLVMFALPGGISPMALLMTLAMGVLIIWTSVALRACLETFLQTRRLLAACPLPTQRLRKAAWHYPALAGAPALICAALGAWWWGFSSVWFAVAAAVLVLTLPASVAACAALLKPS